MSCDMKEEQRSMETDPQRRDELRLRIQQAVKNAPPLPAFYQEALALIRDPDMDFARLAETIEVDPGITMNILKLVNSAYFSRTEPARSLQQAMVRIGSQTLSRIIVAQGVSTQMARRLNGYELEPESLLHHSVGTALTAERLARHLKMEPDKGLFTAGLLHDLGKLFLDPFVCENKERIHEWLQCTDKPFDIIEKEVLGVTHPEAGAWLMRQWGLPDDIVGIVEFHHAPHQASRQEKNALLVHLADTLVYSQGLGDGIDGFRYSVENRSAEKLGLQSIDVEQVAFDAWSSIQEMKTLLHSSHHGR